MLKEKHRKVVDVLKAWCFASFPCVEAVFHSEQSFVLGLQINGTYPCTYSAKNLRTVDITVEKSGNCGIAKEPSSSDLIKQFWYM